MSKRQARFFVFLSFFGFFGEVCLERS